MRGLLIGLIGINWVIFVSLFVVCFQIYRRARSETIRSLTLTFLLVLGVLIIGSTQRALLVATEAGVLPSGVRDTLLFEGQWILVAAGASFGVAGLTVIRRSLRRLERGERMVSVLTERAMLDMSVSDWGLTPRELEVLELIVSGSTSDDEIADSLYISPSTAATHVRNILKKAGLSNRKDLMLVGDRVLEDDSPSTG